MKLRRPAGAESSKPADLPPIRGNVDEPRDGAVVHPRRLVVRGWHAWRGQPALAVVIRVDGRTVAAAAGSEARPDVGENLGAARLSRSGWRVELDLSDEDTGSSEPGEKGGGGVEDRRVTVAITVIGTLEEPPVELPPISVLLSKDAPERAAGASSHGSDPRGHLDLPLFDAVLPRSVIPVVGWAMSDDLPASRVEILLDGESVGLARLGMCRSDIGATHTAPHAWIAGFEHTVDLAGVPGSVEEVTLAARAWVGDTGPLVVSERRYRLAPPQEDGPEAEDDVQAERARLLDARRAEIVPAPAGGVGEKLDLVVFTHHLGYGGGQLWLSEVLRHSGAGKEFPCTVVSQATGALLPVFESQGIEVHVTQEFPPRDTETYEGRLTELSLWLSRRGHNALLANTFTTFVGPDAASRFGWPVVWAIHESWSPDTIWDYTFPPGYVDAGVHRAFLRALGSAGALVFEAEATRQLFETAAAPGRTVLVPYGIDVPSVERYMASVSRTEARTLCRIPAGARVLLVMGTTEPRKAQTQIAMAFAQIVDEFPDAMLVLVGDIGGPYSDALREYIEQPALRDRVVLMPVVPDAYRWYRAADVLVCASDVESLPRSVLEAMAFGVPVVATSVFGLPELITDGVNGYLLPPRDLDATVAALRRVLNADKGEVDEVAAAGRRLVSEQYDSRGYSADVLALLEGLLADPAALPADILARSGRQIAHAGGH